MVKIVRHTVPWSTLTLSVVWRTPVYRSFTTSLFCVGAAISSSMPLVSLFLIRELHMGVTTAGLFFLTVLTSPAVGLVTGRLSDRLPSRGPLIRFSALWLAVGWAIMALVGQGWLAFGVGLIFFCLTGTLSAQIFAALRDVVAQQGETREGTITSAIRTAYSLGWIIGPIIGGWLASTLGVRTAFVATAVLYLASTLSLRHLGIYSPKAANNGNSSTKLVTQADGSLLLFAVVCLLVSSGDAIKLAYLPVYLVNGLKQPILIFGSLLSVSAIVELVVMPTAGVLADRVGVRLVIIGGVAIGILDYAILAGSTTLWQLYLVQVLHTGVIAALLGVGVTYAQRLRRSQPGLASSVFFGAQGLSAPLGGLLGSYGVHLLGVPHVFAIPSLLCAISVGILFATHERVDSEHSR